MIRRALSVRQPWAWAIVNGYKPVENRDRDPVGRYRGPLLIHTGRKPAERESWQALRQCMAAAGEDPGLVPADDALPLGGFVGEAEVVDVVRRHPSPFFFGPVGIVLARARPFALIRWPGKLGLFSVDDAALAIPAPPDARQGSLL